MYRVVESAGTTSKKLKQQFFLSQKSCSTQIQKAPLGKKYQKAVFGQNTVVPGCGALLFMRAIGCEKQVWGPDAAYFKLVSK